MQNTTAAGVRPGALGAGIACYAIWGFIPLLIQVVARRGVGSWEILAQRALWAAPTTLLFVLSAKHFGELRAILGRPRTLAWLLLSAALIATNWIVFIWAVNSGQVLPASFGYYITPLFSLAGGALVFKERLSRSAVIAIGLSILGIAAQGVAVGGLPVVSLVLAACFGIYGIVRKRVAAEAVTGLFVECLFIGIPAAAYVLWLARAGLGHFTASWGTALWLMLTGPATALPLMLFAWTARRIPLSVMGFLQFLTPTISMIIGLAEGEQLTPLKSLSFALIWLGALTFTFDSLWRSRAPFAAVARR